MALFGKPRQIKKLDQEIMAAHIALSLFDRLPADKQQHVLATAPRELSQAATAAAAAGHTDEARALLNDARAKAPDSSAAEHWPSIIDGALAEL